MHRTKVKDKFKYLNLLLYFEQLVSRESKWKKAS